MHEDQDFKSKFLIFEIGYLAIFGLTIRDLPTFEDKEISRDFFGPNDIVVVPDGQAEREGATFAS